MTTRAPDIALVIDTSLNACQAGLFRGDEAVAVAVEPMVRGHQERLPVMVAELLQQSGITPRDLGRIGVTLGPGSFTGLRVGLSFAKGMASGLSLRLRGIGTLDALNAHPDLGGRRPVALISGGRGQVYAQVGDTEAQTLAMDDLADFVTAHAPDTATGPAATMIGLPVFPQAWPSLDAMAARLAIGGHDDVTPLYMRGADAVASTRGIIDISTFGSPDVGLAS